MQAAARFCAGALLACCSQFGLAQGYLIGSIGSTDYHIRGLDPAASASLLIGYNLNHAVALEASYVYLGETSDDSAPVWTLAGEGVILAVRGNLPLTPQLALFGRLGMLRWELTLDEAGRGRIGADEGTDAVVGVGLSLELSREFDLVVEYLNLELDGEQSTTWRWASR